MDILHYMLQGFAQMVSLEQLLAIAVGVAAGILVGAMPGLSPSMGVALLVPFTYRMNPLTALVLLLAVYQAANYGGSITAVTINTPGTPSAVATAWDGFPLTRQGKCGWALGISLVGSSLGGLIGILILIAFAQPLAAIAVKLHPAEYFCLAVLGLTTVASLGGKNWAKAFIAALFGLLLATIGIDPISGTKRYTFGAIRLFDGFDLIPAMIGLFALSEIFMRFEEEGIPRNVAKGEISKKDLWPSIRDYWKLKRVMLQSSIIGTFIGIFPGAGSTIASFLAYDAAKRTSKHPETFGQGNPEGVMASEAANNASVGGAMVPLLTLGIPGSSSTAVLIGALMIHDLVPGPMLFQTNPALVYGMFASMFIAIVVLFAMGTLGARLWIKVTRIPPGILLPMILAVAVMGSFAVNNSMFDVAVCIGFGVLGWVMRRYGFPVAPVVLGLVLGKLAEANFRRAVIMGGYGVFFTRPASLVLLIVSVALFAYPLVQGYLEGRKKAA